MALSATFTANFASFYDAVDKADTKLKDFGAGADKVGGRLTALGNSFSGVKIIQDATLMVKAVEDIGGASKLTEKELARLGATTNEAVEKMKALGMEVPQNLQKIADQTKGATKATTDWVGTLTKVAGAFGIAFSVGAIKDFIGSVFDAAGAVKDLSDQWGVSTQFVQQWSAAAKLSGVETEQLGKSIQYMTEKLSESSPEYDAMIKNIGLSTDALRKMSTEDAYKEIIQKIAGIKDETLQLDVAMGVLGPNAKKIIGGIRDGMYEAADAQKYMSDETIKRLEAAGDAWERFKNSVVIYSGEMLASVQQGLDTMTKSWGTFFAYLGRAVLDPAGAAVTVQADAAMADFQKSLKATGGEMRAVASQSTGLTGAMETTAQVTERLKKKNEALAKAEQDRKAALAALKREEEAYTKTLQDHEQAVNDLVLAFSGGDLVGKANLYLEALKWTIPVEQMTAKEQANINQVMLDAIEVYHAAGMMAPEAMYEIWRATQQTDTSVEDLTTHVQLLSDVMKGLPQFTNVKIPGATVTLKAPKDTSAETLKLIETITAAMAKLGEITGGTFGAIADELAKLVGAMNLAVASSKEFTKGLKAYKAGDTQQGLGQMATGAMGVVTAFQSATQGTDKLHSALNGAAIGFSVAGPWGAAVGAGIGLIKGFINAHKEAKEVKNLRNDFISAAGGITAFTTQAEKAGVSLNALMGAKKKDDLEAAIKKIQDALQGQALEDAFVKANGGLEALTHSAAKAGVSLDGLFAAKSSAEVSAAIRDIDDALKFQADAYQLAIDTAEKYGFTIEELGPAMARQQLDKQAQQLYKDWEVLNSAGIDTILITEKMSKSVSEYVQHAVRMGTEVPDAMRPMLEAMVKSGTLLDANGDAITDLDAAGISFSLSMSDGFKALIEQVKKLTDAISQELGLAIANVPAIKVPVSFEWHGLGGLGRAVAGGQLESYQQGTEGRFKDFGEGTPVMLHGWEAVVPREESGAFATVSGAGSPPAPALGEMRIVLQQDGQTTAEWLLPFIPGAARRLGLAGVY